MSSLYGKFILGLGRSRNRASLRTGSRSSRRNTMAGKDGPHLRQIALAWILKSNLVMPSPNTSEVVHPYIRKMR